MILCRIASDSRKWEDWLHKGEEWKQYLDVSYVHRLQYLLLFSKLCKGDLFLFYERTLRLKEIKHNQLHTVSRIQK
jgi:hypothetical protein